MADPHAKIEVPRADIHGKDDGVVGAVDVQKPHRIDVAIKPRVHRRLNAELDRHGRVDAKQPERVAERRLAARAPITDEVPQHVVGLAGVGQEGSKC